MRDNSNFALDIREATNSKTGSTTCVARIFLNVACSYLKDGGAPTITEECTTLSDFEQEVSRIKSECDAMLAEARPRFTDGESTGDVENKQADQKDPLLQTSDLQDDADGTKKPTIKLEDPLQVADLMTRNIKSMRRNDKLSIADELMHVGKFRHMIVLEDDSNDICGIISHRDIFHGALAWSTGQGKNAFQKSLESIPAKDVMNTEIITTTPETPLAEASQIMLEKKIGCLPVLEDRLLVGILTEGDFLAVLSRAKYGTA
jgi:CBS domain-containing protein